MRTTKLYPTFVALSLLTACNVDSSSAESETGGGGSTTDDEEAGSSVAESESASTTAVTDGDDTTVGATEAGDSTGTAVVAQFRLVHAAAGTANIDVYLAGSGEPILTDLAYGSASDYVEVPVGSLEFEVRLAGSSVDEAPAYTSGGTEITVDATMTAIASGSLGANDVAEGFVILPLIDGFTEPGADQVAVRVVNVAGDLESFDVNVDNDGGTPEVVGVANLGDSGPAGVALSAGTALQLGLERDATVVTAFTMPELPAGAGVFAIVTGQLHAPPRAATGLAMLLVGPDGVIESVAQNPFVYAFHAIPDGGPLDLCVGGAQVATGTTFGMLARLAVPPGVHDIAFHIAPSDFTSEPESTQSTSPVVAGEQYLAIAAGEAVPEEGEGAFTMLTQAEAFTLDAAPDAVLAFIHVASAPALDFGTLDGDQITDDTVLVTDLAFGQTSALIRVPASDLQLGILLAGVALPAAPVGLIATPLAQGMRTWIVAVGDLSPNGGDVPAGVYSIDTGSNPWVAVELL